MALHLDVICHQPGLSADGNAESAARVIGDILPFVLAKYGVAAGAKQDAAKQSKSKQDSRPMPRIDQLPLRFDRNDEIWK